MENFKRCAMRNTCVSTAMPSTMPEPFVQHDVRRLPAHPRKLLKAFHVTGYLATEIAHDHLSARNAIFRLIAEESERMDDIGNLFHIRLCHGLGRSEACEQGRGYLIHVHVGGLCGKSDCDREFEGRSIMKCAFGFGIVFAHAALDFERASKFIRFLLSCHSCPFAVSLFSYCSRVTRW